MRTAPPCLARHTVPQAITSVSALVPEGPALAAKWEMRSAASLRQGGHLCGQRNTRRPHEHGLGSLLSQPSNWGRDVLVSSAPASVQFALGSTDLTWKALPWESCQYRCVFTPIASLVLCVLGPVLPQSFDSRLL